MTDIEVDGASLRDDIETTAAFGAVEAKAGRGRTVLPGTEANGDARDYFVDRARDVGLEVRVDAVGNIVGRWTPASADADAAPVASGSHIDSVPRGGIFDGVLGVYAALEAVRAIKESEVTPERPLEVVCFTAEEGSRFFDGVLGSSVATGKLEPEQALQLSDSDRTLGQALTDIGYHGSGTLDACAWNAWLEVHIDQTTRLRDADMPVGIVTDIAGTTRCHVTIEGEPDHSGSTGMDERTDALAAASELVSGVERRAADVAAAGSGTAVGTVGELEVEPNAPNVVPGEVSLRIDIRSTEQTEIETQMTGVKRLLEALEVRRGVSTTFVCNYEVPPTRLADRCKRAVSEATDRLRIPAQRLHSSAGHDTMQVADVTDGGMLFVASEGGNSHSPLEWADWQDCTDATAVLAESLLALATVDGYET